MTALLAGARWPQAASASASAAAPSARPSSRTVLILGCIPVSIAPPMPALAGTPCRSPYLARPITGLAAAPAGASPSNAVHQSDRELDGCALPEKVEKNLHPPAPGAGPLHDRDQPRERAALDLHPVPRPEGRERPDDAALARARDDERDRAVLQRGGGRTESDEAPHSGRPDHSVVLLEERDAHEEVAREEGRYLVTPPLEDARQEDLHAAPLELPHGVVFLARLAAYHVPPAVLSLKIETRREGGHTAPGGVAISMPRARAICSRDPRFSSAFAPQGAISNPPFSRTPAALVQARSRVRRHRPEGHVRQATPCTAAASCKTAPRPCLGAGGTCRPETASRVGHRQRACGAVHRADGVPRPAKPARPTFRSGSA